MASELLWSAKPPVQPCPHTVEHDLESFEWVILFAVYKHTIRHAHTGAKERLVGLTKEFQNIFPAGIEPAVLADKRTILLEWPKSLALDFFENIQELLSFVENVMGSKELHDVLMDIWQDLVYRKLALLAHFKGPAVRSRSMFQNESLPVFDLPKCLNHQELIQCLENLIPRS